MKKYLYKLWTQILTIFGDIKIFRFPFFLVYDPDAYQATGDHISRLLEILQPGDILLRGYNHYADGYAVQYFGTTGAQLVIGDGWSHGALYMGNNKVIHAIAKGVQEINLLDFLQCDRIAVLRPRAGAQNAMRLAQKFLDNCVPYDFGYQTGASALYCFELVALTYPDLNIPSFTLRKCFGLITRENAYIAQSFTDSPDCELIFCCNPRSDIFINTTNTRERTMSNSLKYVLYAIISGAAAHIAVAVRKLIDYLSALHDEQLEKQKQEQIDKHNAELKDKTDNGKLSDLL